MYNRIARAFALAALAALFAVPAKPAAAQRDGWSGRAGYGRDADRSTREIDRLLDEIRRSECLLRDLRRDEEHARWRRDFRAAHRIARRMDEVRDRLDDARRRLEEARRCDRGDWTRDRDRGRGEERGGDRGWGGDWSRDRDRGRDRR